MSQGHQIVNVCLQCYLSPQLRPRYEIFSRLLEDPVKHQHHYDSCIWAQGKGELLVMLFTFKFLKFRRVIAGTGDDAEDKSKRWQLTSMVRKIASKSTLLARLMVWKCTKAF